MTGDGERPTLRIVRGDATDTEVAALAAVLLARAAAPGSGSAGPAPADGGWRDRTRALRTPLHAAPGAWRSSVR